MVADLRQLLKQGNTLVLQGKLLAVLQRQVQEYPMNQWQPQVAAAGDGVLRQCQRLRVTAKSLRRAAVDIA